MTGVAYKWFESYLSGREQCVLVEGMTSSSRPLTCGVPQGSVLGLELFKIYSTPLADIIREFNVDFHAYADDKQLWIVLEPNSDCEEDLHHLIICYMAVKDWLTTNMLLVNDEKNEFCIIGTRQQRAKVNISGIQIGDCFLPAKDSVKNLGVYFDSSMSMKKQISSICSSTYYHLHNISAVRSYLNRDATELAVHAFVTSRLDNCNSLLYGCSKNQLHRLQVVQNFAAKTVLCKRKYDHATPLLVELHWLPIEWRIKYKLIVLTYKALNGMAPQYLTELLKVKKSARSLRSNNKLLLKVPRSHLKSAGDRTFMVAAPKHYNDLPEDIKQAGSLETFKHKLKTHLFRLAFPGEVCSHKLFLTCF